MFRIRESSSAPTQDAKCKSRESPTFDKICSICRDNISSKASATIDCSHTFHLKCVRQWINEKQTCPNCRAPVTFMKCGWRKVNTKQKPKKPSLSFVAKLVGWFTQVHGEPKQFITGFL